MRSVTRGTEIKGSTRRSAGARGVEPGEFGDIHVNHSAGYIEVYLLFRDHFLRTATQRSGFDAYRLPCIFGCSSTFYFILIHFN